MAASAGRQGLLQEKLPELQRQVERVEVELKRKKVEFLEQRVTDLEEMKDSLNSDSNTPNFKTLSQLKEEKLFC